MTKSSAVIISIFTVCQCSTAQISPGELSAAHAQLEGTQNCTQCHSMGKALANDHCLSCHTEIKTRIDGKKGFHATAGAKQCFECHREHHGVQFDLIRFDRKTFNHSTVGYALEGRHRTIECVQCHAKDRITDADIRKFPDARKAKTLLGLSAECLSCHQDQHRGQLSQQCASCHTFGQWKPAAKFSHDRAKFQLTGKHANVSCLQCHKNTLADGKTIQYVKMEFASCKACHADPHKGKFQQPCSQCHATDDFRSIKNGQFNHTATQFPLVGKHTGLKCEQCHSNNPKAKNVSGETGFHITKYHECGSCHADAHAHQFDARRDAGRCEACHNETGFANVQFSSADHAKTAFALTGGHAATPCTQCHEAGKVKAKSTRQFRWEKKVECTTCHADIHRGQFAATMTRGCETCHTTDAWQNTTFSHEKTRFPLRGKHGVTECSKCHKPGGSVGASAVQYAGVSMRCGDCHADEHGKQFAENGITRCDQCHTEKNWKALTFDHQHQSRFELTGKHANVPCEKCHHSVAVNNTTFVRYKPLGILCTDCHSTN